MHADPKNTLHAPQEWLDKFSFIKDSELRRQYHAMVRKPCDDSICSAYLGGRPGFRLAARWNRVSEAVKTRKRREKTGGEMGEMV